MRILVITLEYSPRIMGGAGIYIEKTIQHLVSFGHEVHILTLSSSMQYQRSGMNPVIHRLPVIPFPTWRTLCFWFMLPFYYKRVQKANGPFNLVHSNGISDLTLGKRISPEMRFITVHHLFSTVVDILKPSILQQLIYPGNEIGIIRYLEKISYTRADHIIAVSEATRSDLTTRLKIPAERIDVIHHGASPEEYKFPTEELTTMRRALDIREHDFLLFVGRLEERKGIHILLEAFTQVCKEREAVLVLAGGGDYDKYSAHAQRLGIYNRTRFLGFVDPITLNRLYASCDLVVFPSLWEGFGLVAIEARAAGKFVIASNVGGIPEAVPPGTGYLVPPDDTMALSQAIVRALQESHPALTPVPTWQQATTALINTYQRILGSSSNQFVARESVNKSKI